MIIYLKNKHTLKVDDFYFKCSIGKNGLSSKKREGDKKTPKGLFSIDKLFIRKDRIKRINTKLRLIKIKKNMGWCNDINYPKKYNKLIKIEKKISHEKIMRHDYKYDMFVPIKYNFDNPIRKKGSCIFIHLTKDYKPTLGCIALGLKDFKIMLRLINKNTKIKIS